MNYISLFSGIEAASIAWQPLGWEPLAFAEIAPFPSALLEYRYPDVPNLGDVTKVDWGQYRGKVALVVGGFPCQSFSVAGQRRGLGDERGNLSFEYVRAVHAVDPRYAVAENVPGWLSSRDNAFGHWLSRLVGADAPLVPPEGLRWTDAGMVVGPKRTAAWRVFDAQHFGVPQRRRRVFVVSLRAGDRISPGQILFEPESVRRHITSRREKGERIAASLTRGSASGRGVNEPGRRREDDVNLVVANTLGSHRSPRYDLDNDTYVYQCQGTNVGEMGTLRTGNGHVTGEVPFALVGNGEYHEGVAPLRAEGGDCGGGSANRVDAVAQTVTSTYGRTAQSGGNNGAPINVVPYGMSVRRLTPREAERLQGFEDDYTLVPYRGKLAADGPRYAALGNSMAVPVIRWIGERILEAEKEV